MLSDRLDTQTNAQLRREVHALRREMVQMRRDMAMAFQAMTNLLLEVKGGQMAELQSAHHLEQILGDMQYRPIQPVVTADTSHCHVCGGPLEHHGAQAGQLLLCPSCGWSEFVGRDGLSSNEVRPDDVPMTVNAQNWVS